MVKTKLFNWIGGKKWLSKDLNDLYSNILKSKKINTYVEPFAGGLGSFLCTLDILKEFGVENYFLNDVNETIITIYNQIKENPYNLFEEYWKIEEEYAKLIPKEAFKLHKTKQKIELKELLIPARDYYESQKVIFNNLKMVDINKSIPYFLFLSQHSFNGVYRENSKGGFNTPFNWDTGVYKKNDKLAIFEEYNCVFNSVNVYFKNESAFEFIKSFKNNKDTMFYLDPPYLNEGTGENKYNKDHFGIEQQKELLKIIKEMDTVVFSNHYLILFLDFCKENDFDFKEVFRSNLINSDPTKRSIKISEILAFKY